MIATATTAPSDMRIVVIPAKSREEIKQSTKCLKVAAYCRVSTDEEEQKTSYQAQIEYYTDKIISGKTQEQMYRTLARLSELPAYKLPLIETIKKLSDIK